MSINGDTIYVLPCLQELKTSASYTLNEGEQQTSNFYGTSDKFDKYWRGTSQDPDVIMTKDGLLTIPNCSTFGFNSDNTNSDGDDDHKDLSTTECKKFSRDKKWSIYAKFLADKCEDKNKKNVALLVTHHNRMRDKDVDQGLIPFKEGSPYNGYANNCCLKISITNGNIKDNGYSLFFRGFPDKGEFTSDNDDGQIGGGDYKYFDDETNFKKFIDTTLITKGINDANIDKTIDIDIYVIRHGNSLHNKPVKAWFGRLDSSLTPLGMYQAKVLGEKFKPILTNDTNDTNIILCSSFLQRAQLTGLLLLKNANITFNNTMKNGVEKLMYEAMKRYLYKKGENVKIFEKYNPANEDFDVFNKYFNDEYDEYQKYEAKTNEKINKSLEDFIGDVGDDDAPRFIPSNQGGKKRRQTKKQRVMKSKKVRRVKKLNKKSKKVKRRSNKRKA